MIKTEYAVYYNPESKKWLARKAKPHAPHESWPLFPDESEPEINVILLRTEFDTSPENRNYTSQCLGYFYFGSQPMGPAPYFMSDPFHKKVQYLMKEIVKFGLIEEINGGTRTVTILAPGLWERYQTQILG